MTIEERFDRLTERHEALTMHVELITGEIQQISQDIKRISGDVDKLVAVSKQDAENIRALVRIAELHHERLERLEK